MEKKEEKIRDHDLHAQHVYANLISFQPSIPRRFCLGLGIRDVKDAAARSPSTPTPT